MSECKTDIAKQCIALLVIDVQQALFERARPIYNAGRLLDNLSNLIQRAHDANALVVYIQHDNKGILAKGGDGWQLHPRLVPQSGDLLIQKRHGDAFQGTPLGGELEARNVGTVVICGLLTHQCIKATTIGAHQRGYQVILVEDGHSNYHEQAASLITEWNQKLGDGIAVLKPAQDVAFGE